MAARGDGVEGDERVWVVVVGRGEPGWRLSVEGEFGCELELGAAMVAAVRLGCASRELCVGKKRGGREGGVGRFGLAREAGQLGQNLQLLFQAFSHLRFGLKVTNSNLNAKEITLNTLFFEFFSKFCVLT